MSSRPAWAPIRLVALDLDGVVWRGQEVLPAAPEALADVLRRGLDLRYVSNNATAHREDVSKRLAAAGLPAGADRVLTSAFAAAWWLKGRLSSGARVMVLGEDGLRREIEEVGLIPYFAGQAELGEPVPAAVVVAMDRSFSYDSLAAAQTAIRSGALFVATNRDATFPVPGGLRPGAGAIVAAVEVAAGKEPALMGKPALTLAETLASVTRVPPGETLFVGDRLETDILMSANAGMITALVLTGISTRGDVQEAAVSRSTPVPDHVLEDLTQLPELLDRLTAGSP
jgi:phosphoglycolate/pyridoxal phosphate phosphatase family enzyme